MERIGLDEQKRLLVEILKYITDICDKNNIKYSLIGGSLIGAIRHKGIIPWDDDIDIILMPEEYDKLIDVLSKIEHYYVLFNPDTNKNYYYPFAKLVDTRTVMKENGYKDIDNYGIYVDIFKYYYVSDIEFIRKIHYKRYDFVKMLFSYSCLNYDEIKSIKRKIIYRILKIFGSNYFKKRMIKLCSNNKKTNYMLSNWPAYGYSKEIQNPCDMVSYKKVKFENIDAMITENYDNILKTIFGDYMKLPPKEKRIKKHDNEVYWR